MFLNSERYFCSEYLVDYPSYQFFNFAVIDTYSFHLGFVRYLLTIPTVNLTKQVKQVLNLLEQVDLHQSTPIFHPLIILANNLLLKIHLRTNKFASLALICLIISTTQEPKEGALILRPRNTSFTISAIIPNA